MSHPWRVGISAWLVVGLLSGCATKETIPSVGIAPNASGIETGTPQTHGPYNLLGAIGVAPNIPSGVTVPIQNGPPLRYEAGRYFIAASGTLQVVSVERIATYNTKYHSDADDLQRWKSLLDRPPDNETETRHILYDGQLSEIPLDNAGRCFHAKLRYRTFPWGKALLFLTSYVQGKTGGPVNNAMLVLVVQGLTNDGRYAVCGHLKIRHPRLPESSWDKYTGGKSIFDIDDDDAKAEKWLDAQPDNSFEPTFRQYESFLESLRIEPPGQ